MACASRTAHLIAVFLVTLLLTACGGGGNVRSAAGDPPGTGTTDPPGAGMTELCPEPLTGDCIANVPYTLTYDEIQLTGGRQSDAGLIVRGTGWLNLHGDYRFGGGTTVESGALIVHDLLRSDTVVQAGSELWLVGTLQGDLVNDGRLSYRTLCEPGGPCDGAMRARIEGDYHQTATGSLEAVLGWTLQVTGRTIIDGGTLALVAQRLEGGGYVLPDSGTSQHILHSDGGVIGRFDDWNARSLFLEGSLRYDANDIFFDVTRISTASAMEANGASSPIALASAARLDAAFAEADAFARQPIASLDPEQRNLLASAAAIQRIGEIGQATRTLESLSGHAHALVRDALRDQADARSAWLDMHLDRLVPAMPAGTWGSAVSHAGQRAGVSGLDGYLGGFDQWLDSRWLVGASFGSSRSRMHFDRMGGNALGESPSASVYARALGANWQATGVAGITRTSMRIQRPIDLGSAGVHLAQSQRRFEQTYLSGEFARRIDFANGRLSPFVGLDYSMSHGDGFRERGDTGFELAAGARLHTLLSGTAGLRYTHDWRLAGQGWLRLDLDARYERRIDEGGERLHAVFVGTPDAAFDPGTWRQSRDAGVTTLALVGQFGGGWRPSMTYARRFDADAPDGSWSVAIQRDF